MTSTPNLSSPSEALQRADEAADLCVDESGHKSALALFETVLQFVEAHLDECEEEGLTLGPLLENMAICAQQVGDFDRMRELTSKWLMVDEMAALGQHAIALHHTGALDEARDTIDRAIAEQPFEVYHHQERASILLALDQAEAALQSVGAAIALGADLEEMLGDADLAGLRSDPRIEEMLSSRPTDHAFAFSLFDRLNAWAQIFSRRSDLEFTNEGSPVSANEAMRIQRTPAAQDVLAAYPPDAGDFAQAASGFALEYRHRDDAEIAGSVFLSLEGFAAASVPKRVEGVRSAVVLEHDVLGTGLAAFAVRRGDQAPSILWDLENQNAFVSLEEYLTEGARRAFAYGGAQPFGCWQTKPRASRLAQLSLPRWTSDADLTQALIERGAKPEMAVDLLKWLGKDAVLLVPAGA
jgi:hypothetical protein